MNIKDNDAAFPDLLTLFSTFLNISSASEYETLNPDGTCSFEVITSGDKSCWFTNDYKRQCDDPRIDLMGKTAQECLEQGSTQPGPKNYEIFVKIFGAGLRYWDKTVVLSLVKIIVLIMKTAFWHITIHQIRSGQKSINQFVSYSRSALQHVIGTAENLFQDQEHKCFNALQQNAIFQILIVELEKKVHTVTMKTLIRAGINELNRSEL